MKNKSSDISDSDTKLPEEENDNVQDKKKSFTLRKLFTVKGVLSLSLQETYLRNVSKKRIWEMYLRNVSKKRI